MNLSRLRPRRLRAWLLVPLALVMSLPAGAQADGAQEDEERTPYDEEVSKKLELDKAREAHKNRKRHYSPFFMEVRNSYKPAAAAPGLSTAWDDPEAIRKGTEMKERLIEAAGGWEAFEKLGGLRYDLLMTTKVNTVTQEDSWRVHHYEPRLCHFNIDGNGYVYTEFARPSLTGPDFVREVVYKENMWREMRGSFLRTFDARRTAYESVKTELLQGLMPFSLRMLDTRLAFVRRENSPAGKVEVYALQMEPPLLVSFFPMVQEQYGLVNELLLYIDPEEEEVVQILFAFADPAVKKPPHLRWWTIDFEGSLEIGGVRIPHKRFRWLEGWRTLEELEIADLVPEAVPPPAFRRPWHSDAVYQMPYRCDFWDPDHAINGLTGHDTGLPHPRPGTYPPDHPKHRGKFPPLKSEEDSEEDAPGPDDSPR